MDHSVIAPNVKEFPVTLQESDQWVLWNFVPGKDGKPQKLPFQLSGEAASTSDQTTWTTLDAVTSAYSSGSWAGIGWCFPVKQPEVGEYGLVGVDLDGCRNPATGELDEWAFDVLTSFNGTYAEISPSGTGVKILAIGRSPFETGKNQNGEGQHFGTRFGKRIGIEIYDHKRFFCLTGNRLPDADREPMEAPPKALERVKAIVEQWNAAGKARKAAERDALKTEATVTPTSYVTSGDIVERCRKYIRTMPGAIAGQCGHNQTFAVACVLAKFGLSESDGRTLLQEYNARCQPPWDERDLEHKLTSGYQRVRQDGLFGTMAHSRPAHSTATGAARPAATSTGLVGGEQPEPPPEIVPLTLPTLTARYPQMREPLIPGLLRRGEIMNVIAPPKVGKSWLVHGLALSMATGLPWLGFPSRRGRVLLADNELHHETLAGRLSFVADRLGATHDDIGDNLQVVPMRGEGWDIERLALGLWSVEPRKYDLLIVDALYRALPEYVRDENDNAGMTLLYNALDRLARRLDCCVVIVHHASKGNQSGKAVTDIGAGAGAQSRATDVHLTLRPLATDGGFRLDTAVRSFAPLAPRALRFEYPLWHPADDLDPADLLREKPRKGSTRTPTTDDAPRWTIERFVDEFAGPLPSPKSDILARATDDGLSQREAEKLFRLATGAGKLHLWPSPDKRQKLFATVEPALLTTTH